MSKWNYQLFENFKQAAEELNINVRPGWNYYSLDLPNGEVYAYCWTPLNKMRGLGDLTPDEALRHIKDNQDDFHLEFDKYGCSETGLVFYNLLGKNSSVEDIKSAIKLLLDETSLEKHRFMNRIKYSEEETE